MAEEEQEYIEYKIILLGESQTGKHAFIDRITKLHGGEEVTYVTKEDNANKKDEKDKQKKTEDNKSKKETLKTVSSKKDVETELKTQKSQELERRKSRHDKKSVVFKVGKHRLVLTLYYTHQANWIPPYESTKRSDVFSFLPYFDQIEIKNTLNEDEDLKQNQPISDRDIYTPERENELAEEQEKANNYNKDKIFCSFTELRKEIDQILNNRDLCYSENMLYNYKVSTQVIFVYFFDLSNNKSFYPLQSYVKFIHKYLKEENNNIEGVQQMIIGNKLDKQYFNEGENSDHFGFAKSLEFFYIELASNYTYNVDLFYQKFINFLHENSTNDLFRDDNFIDLFKKEISKRSATFSRQERNFLQGVPDNPGPNAYDLNIYSCIDRKELEKALVGKNSRFKSKIFINKSGPVFSAKIDEKKLDKGGKEQAKKDQKQQDLQNDKEKFRLNLIQRDLQREREEANNPKNGITLGIKSGVLNLRSMRKSQAKVISQELKGSFEENNLSDLFKVNTDKKVEIRGDDYFERAKMLKNQEHFKNLEKFLESSKKYESINKENKQRLELERSKKFFGEKSSMLKSSQSLPEIESTESNSSSIFQKDYKRENYLRSIWKNNSDHLMKAQEVMLRKNKSEIFKSPGPGDYNICGNLLNSKRGVKILGKSPERKIPPVCPEFPLIKDDFEILIEKNQNRPQISSKGQRFQYPEREKPLSKEDLDILQYAKKEFQLSPEVQAFLTKRKDRRRKQEETMKSIQEQKLREIEEIKKAQIYKQKLDCDWEMRPINYSQVEESSPSYSLRGKCQPRERNFNYILGGNSSQISGQE